MVLERDPQEPIDLDGKEDAGLSNFEETLPAVAEEAKIPAGLPDQEREDLRARALGLANELAVAEGAKEMELIDSVTSLGMQAQRNGGSKMELLRVRVGDLISQSGSESEVASGLVDMRMALNEIDPSKLSHPGVFRSAASVFPFVTKITPPIKVLQKIAMKYEPVSRQIENIEAKLREGRTILTRDNVELRQVYEQVEAQRLPIQKNAYLGELLMEHLKVLLEETKDPVKVDKIQEALYDVSIRVQALRVMDEVYDQFTVGIQMTRQNNSRLGRAVEQTLSIATNVVTVGLAIQAALIRERQVMEANTRTREYIGELILANATLIKRHTVEIGEVYDQPVIAMDKITQAHRELMEAMEIADRLKKEGVEKAIKNIEELDKMSGKLHQNPALAGGTNIVGSIEA